MYVQRQVNFFLQGKGFVKQLRVMVGVFLVDDHLDEHKKRHNSFEGFDKDTQFFYTPVCNKLSQGP
jgi:hypothetical protein